MKNITHTLLICVLILFTLSSCQEDDDRVFSETPTARIAANSSRLSRLLTSSPAFRTNYFPKNSEYGGAQIYLRFTEDGKVFMSSNFDENVDITESLYEVRFATSTELVFSTFNHITKLGDNNLPGLRGTGFEGASNFVFVEETEDGGIILEDFRNESKFTLVPVSRSEFDSSPDLAVQGLANKSRLVPGPTTSVFKQLTVQDEAENVSFDLVYDEIRFFGTAQSRGVNGEVTKTITFGITFTPSGLTVSPAIEVNGISHEDFDYDMVNDNFVSTVAGSTAVLGSSNEPAFITNDFQFLENEGDPAIGYRPFTWGDSPLTSQGFQALLNETDVNLNPRSFSRIQFNPTFPSAAGSSDCESILFIWYFSNGTEFRADYCFSAVTVNDRKLFLTYSGPSGGNGTAREAQMRPIIDFFASENGLIVTSEGGFSTSERNFSNLSGTLTSVDNPSQRVYFLKF